MARILLVEGDEAVAEPLAHALARAGHATTTVPTGSEALALIDDDAFDIALVDMTLPDGDGTALVQALHQHGRVPVVVLSDSRESADREAWRDGAEDYVVKPVAHREAISLVRAVLRRWRAAGGAGEVLRVGPVALDTIIRQVRLDDRELKLPPKEIALLTRLMRDAGRPVSREELMQDVWGEQREDSSRTLDVHVGTLRSRLGDDPSAPRFIHTVRGVGFRFSSPAELPGADGGGATSGAGPGGH
ncbi:MAG TPA: response regulator transcription factor [Conexibacter sp.]|nr:response regulator transcription factor [Conexibacter sp.]